MTNVRGNILRINRKIVISENEFQGILRKAEAIEDKFFRLRVLAVLCVLRLTGKRRGEIAKLEVNDFKIENNFLNITFTLEKKRKGKILTKQSTKAIPLSDPLTKPILEYLDYLNDLESKPKYFLPRMKCVFGFNMMVLDAHISGRQVFNLVRDLSEEVWPHLFRETVASDVIKSDPSIIGAFKVQRRLDLKDYRTGFNYLRRFASDVIQREIEELEKSVK
jgi:integrase